MAHPAEALQQPVLPQPALNPALPLLPAPLHQADLSQAGLRQPLQQLTVDLGWAQAITALTVQNRGQRLIKYPGAEMLDGSPDARDQALLLHGIKASPQPAAGRCRAPMVRQGSVANGTGWTEIGFSDKRMPAPQAHRDQSGSAMNSRVPASGAAQAPVQARRG